MLGMMSPGPNVVAVIGTSTSLGRRAGAALASDEFCWVTGQNIEASGGFRL